MNFWSKIKIAYAGVSESVAAIAGKLYAVSNNAALDATVIRAGATATRIDSAGNIVSVPANQARIDFGLGTDHCPNLLVERSVQNGFIHSIDFSNAVWNKNAITPTYNVAGVIDPRGLEQATLIVPTAVNTEHNLNCGSSIAITTGQVVTYSVWVKAESANLVQLVIGGFAFTPANPYVNFGLIGEGVIYAGAYINATIQKGKNGWYKCSITVVAAANGAPNIQVCPILSSTQQRVQVFTGNGTGVYVWQAQITFSSTPLSDIITTGTAVTKPADVIQKTGLSGVIPQTAGSILFDAYLQAGSLSDSVVRTGIGIATNANNRMAIGRTNNNLLFDVVNGGVSQASISGAIINPIRNKRIKAIGMYENNNFNLYINGALVGTDNSGTVPATSIMTVGGSVVANQEWDGLVRFEPIAETMSKLEREQFFQYDSLEQMSEEMQYIYEA